MVADHAKLIIDTRGVMRDLGGPGDNLVSA